MADNLKVGDVVTLKGSTILMTVIEIINWSESICVWFDTTNNLHQQRFQQEALVLFKSPESEV